TSHASSSCQASPLERELPTSCMALRCPADPLADVDRTVLERGTPGLATCEKSHGMPVDEAHVLQVQHLPLRCFGVHDPLQLGDVLDADSPTHGEDHEVASHRSLNPQHLRPLQSGANLDSRERTSCSALHAIAAPDATRRKHWRRAFRRSRLLGNLRSLATKRGTRWGLDDPGSDAYQRVLEGFTTSSGTRSISAPS